MTSNSWAARDGHNKNAAALDLSSVFGTAAASSLRPLVPRHTRKVRERETTTSDVDEPETRENDVPDTGTRRASAAARPTRTTVSTPVAPRRSDPPAPGRRVRAVKVRDRQHIDMLLLAAATKGPANGRELIDIVRERSDGLFMLSVRTVYYELHRLTNNRLMEVGWTDGARRYVLTPLGERVLATRRREWEAFSRGFDKVLELADDGDRG
jgi:DNA-binding PadR family transcriptional regulator